MDCSQGILTARGGMTSHAAVVARGMGTCCCRRLRRPASIDEEANTVTMDGKVYHEGDCISIDGSTGNVYGGADPHRGSLHLRRLRAASWAGLTTLRKLQVRTNADTPRDAAQAVALRR